MKTVALLLCAQLIAGDPVEVERGLLEPGDAGVPASTLEQLAGAAADAGVPGATLVQLELGAFDVAGGVGWHVVGPGCYLPSATCVGVGQVLTRQGTEIPKLEQLPPGVMPEVIAAVIGFALGFASAIGGAVLACKLAPSLCR